MGYVGNDPNTLSFVVTPNAKTLRFSGDNSSKLFDIGIQPKDHDLMDVYFDGIHQDKNTYVVYDGVVNFDLPPPVGLNNIEISVIDFESNPVGIKVGGGFKYPLEEGDIPDLSANKIYDLDQKVRSFTLDELSDAIDDVSLGGNRIVNVAEPIDDDDAATKGYISSILLGGGVALTGDQTVGGVKTFTDSPVVPTVSTSDSSGKVASTKFVKDLNYLTKNPVIVAGTGTKITYDENGLVISSSALLDSDIPNLDTSKLTTGTLPVSRGGTGANTVSGIVKGNGTSAFTAAVAGTDFVAPNTAIVSSTKAKITYDSKGLVTSGENLLATDIPTLTVSKLSDFDTSVKAYKLSDFSVPVSDISLNGYKITTLATPTSDSDAATKKYVDDSLKYIDGKSSVAAATTGNVALTGLISIDSIALSEDDRVLVKDQTSPQENGIYLAKSAGWIRATDADSWDEFRSSFVFVERGTINGESGWLCTADIGGTLGTTAINWVKFTGADQIEAGTGLTKTDNTINVVGTANRISVSADAVDISTSYVGQTSITTLGTITTGTWDANVITVSRGGTGASTLTGIVKGNGTSAFTAAVSGTDFVAPNASITGSTKAKITYDSKGLVTSGDDLLATDIPNLDTSKLTTGTLPVSRGGSGVSTLTGLVKGNGTSAFTTAVAGTDFVSPNAAIVSSTNTKISYDSKGLVTGGETPTTLAGYSINNAYTKTEADALLNNVNIFSKTFLLMGC